MKTPPGVGGVFDSSVWGGLLHIGPALLTVPLASQSFLCPALFTRLQIEGVTLDLLNDVFLLNFALETSKRAFERFAVL